MKRVDVYVASIALSLAAGCVATGVVQLLASQLGYDNPYILVPHLLYWFAAGRIIIDKRLTTMQCMLVPLITYIAFWLGVWCIAAYEYGDDLVHSSVLDSALGGVILPDYPLLRAPLYLFGPIFLLGLFMAFRGHRQFRIRKLGCGQHSLAIEHRAMTCSTSAVPVDAAATISLKEAVNEVP